MTESRTPARPSQVTMAGWVAVVGSALLVLTLFDSMSQIRSIEMRESIEEFLTTSPGSGLGLDTAEVLEIMRGLMLFAGAAAAAATVLAVYVLQRNNGARVGFTIAAAAIMLTAPVTGSPFAVLVAAAAMMLWTRPARDWFAGRAPAPVPAREHRGVAVSSADPPPGETTGEGGREWPRMPDPSSDRPVPPPTQGFGSATPPSSSPSSPPPDQPGYPDQSGYPGQQGQPGQPGQVWPTPYGQQPQQYGGYPAYGQPPSPDRRPTTVTLAAWLTWVFSGLTLVAFGFVVLVLLVARDDFVSTISAEPEFQSLNLRAEDLIGALWVTSAVVIVWCVAAIALAVLAYRRQNWARITLVVSAAAAALVGLAAIASLISLVNVLAAAATIALLFSGGANQWYSRAAGGYPSYPQQYPSYDAPYGTPQYPQQAGQYGDQPGYGGPSGAPQQGGPQCGGQGQPAPGGEGHAAQPGQPSQQGEPSQPSQQSPPGPPGQPSPQGQPGQQGQPESGDKKDPPTNVW